MGLSDVRLRKMKPKEKRFEVSDGKGLSLLVLPSGTKSWILRYQFNGKPKRLTLGQYPVLSLAVARQKIEESRNNIQNGIDPSTIKTEEKQRRLRLPTIQGLVDELWDKELSLKKSGKETFRLLNHDVLPVWGDRKVVEIKRRDIVLLLDDIESRAPVTRNRVHGALSRLFNFAAERGVLDDSPCTRIRKVAEQGRRRVLDDKEIKRLWWALDFNNKSFDVYVLTKIALKIMLLTGQRAGEVIGMRWDEIDGNNWNIPASRMKNKEPHYVPLSLSVLKLISDARLLSGESAFVFKSPRGKNMDAAITVSSLSRALKRNWHKLGEGADRYTPHDLRRTVRTRLAGLGVNDIVAERLLGHKLQGIMSIYNRHDYEDEKKSAIGVWSCELERIVNEKRCV